MSAKAKTSHDDDHLDFGKIEQEVHSAVISEEKYWRENDAKIRAVEQRVPTYDDFRDIVLAAHLRPLEKGDKISDMGTFTQVWNQSFDPYATNDPANGAGGDKSGTTQVKVPKTGQEFAQAWRRLPKDKEQKKDFLLSIGADVISNLFRTEIADGLLGEFFECFLTFVDSEAESILELLGAFSKSQRFSLSLAFLGKNEKANGASIFAKLKMVPSFKDSVEIIKRIQDMATLYHLA